MADSHGTVLARSLTEEALSQLDEITISSDEEPAPGPEQAVVTSGDSSSWAAKQEVVIKDQLAKHKPDQAPRQYHIFQGHRQVGGGARTGNLYEIFTSRLGLACWRDHNETIKDVPAMICGVAQSCVYMLYLTSDALSYYVTLEARVAMMLGKPAIIVLENDPRLPSFAGKSVEIATKGWPKDLAAYFEGAAIKYCAWGGAPHEWSEERENAVLADMLKWCMAVKVPIPSDATGWNEALELLRQKAMIVEEGSPTGRAQSPLPEAPALSHKSAAMFPALERDPSIEQMDWTLQAVSGEAQKMDTCRAKLARAYPQETTERDSLIVAFKAHLCTALGHLMVSKLSREHEDLCEKLLREVVPQPVQVLR